MKITINKLIEFKKSNSDKKRYSIIRPYKFKTQQNFGYYQTFKSKVKRFYTDKMNIEHILEGVSKLKNSKPDSKFKEINKRISLEAFERFLAFKFPLEFKNITILEPLYKNFIYNGLDINVGPDVIFKIEIGEGEYVLGCVKLHNTQKNTFEIKEQELVSTLLYEYLYSLYGNKYLISSEICYSFDVFSNGYISTNRKKLDINRKILKETIELYFDFWNKTA